MKLFMKSLKIICCIVIVQSVIAATHQQHPSQPTPIGITIHSTNNNQPKVTSQVICGRTVTVESVAHFSDSTRSSHHTASSAQTVLAPQENSSCSTDCTGPCSQASQSLPPQLTVNLVENHSPKYELNTSVDMSKPEQQQTRAKQTHVQFDPILPEETLPSGAKPIYQNASQVPALPSWTLSSMGLLAAKLCVGAGICYSAVLAKMLYTSYVTLAKNDTWSSWKQNIPINLLNNTESQLTKELFADIQAKYTDAHNETSFLNPLVHFYNDIDAETAQLLNFLKLHDWLNHLKIAPIFPRQHESLHLAAKKIKRLEMLKKLVIKSIAEYKVSA